jgi:hypothetical protein
MAAASTADVAAQSTSAGANSRADEIPADENRPAPAIRATQLAPVNLAASAFYISCSGRREESGRHLLLSAKPARIHRPCRRRHLTRRSASGELHPAILVGKTGEAYLLWTVFVPDGDNSSVGDVTDLLHLARLSKSSTELYDWHKDLAGKNRGVEAVRARFQQAQQYCDALTLDPDRVTAPIVRARRA